MLTPNFVQAKRLRSTGRHGEALALIESSAAHSDDDAFEAVICLFTAGKSAEALQYRQRHAWKDRWAMLASGALAGTLEGSSPSECLALARDAIREPGVGADAIAVYLLLLQMSGLIEEATEYIQTRLPDLPADEILLLTITGEIAIAVHDWQRACALASLILASNPDNFRALQMSSIASFELANTHEALGAALRADRINPRAPAVIRQLMTCQNKFGDYYAALGSFGKLGAGQATPEIYAQLGMAYAGLGNRQDAIIAYRNALKSSRKSAVVIRNLLEIYLNSEMAAEVDGLMDEYAAPIRGDVDCVYLLGLDRMKHRDLNRAQDRFKQCLALNIEQQIASGLLAWPVPGSRIHHDYEQLMLLQQRGKLSAGAQRALPVLKRYYDEPDGAERMFFPVPGDEEALKHALSDFHYLPQPAFAGRALHDNDYAGIEDSYFKNSPSLVVIDNFLAPDALANLREFCAEATIWKTHYKSGYVGATLSEGFNPPVLLAIADELRQAMPRVIGGHALTLAWAFKYDQNRRGIELHADFARVNVNFWITPDDACADHETGGLLIYDRGAPAHWTPQDYNKSTGKIEAFVTERGAKPRRVPYRENRCVLFDSALFHATDELHFKPGYTNRRVNVTFLYGKALIVD